MVVSVDDISPSEKKCHRFRLVSMPCGPLWTIAIRFSSCSLLFSRLILVQQLCARLAEENQGWRAADMEQVMMLPSLRWCLTLIQTGKLQVIETAQGREQVAGGGETGIQVLRASGRDFMVEVSTDGKKWTKVHQ
eukprot:759279-Hanusia_phi.AAC.5